MLDRTRYPEFTEVSREEAIEFLNSLGIAPEAYHFCESDHGGDFLLLSLSYVDGLQLAFQWMAKDWYVNATSYVDHVLFTLWLRKRRIPGLDGTLTGACLSGLFNRSYYSDSRRKIEANHHPKLYRLQFFESGKDYPTNEQYVTAYTRRQAFDYGVNFMQNASNGGFEDMRVTLADNYSDLTEHRE